MSILLLLFGGCASDQTMENSALPWNRPAPWEHRRDISTSLEFHKEYKPGALTRAKLKKDQGQTRIIVERTPPNTSETLRAHMISNEPEFFSKPQDSVPISVTKDFPEELRPYDFSKKK